METAVVFGDVHGESELLERLISTAHERYGNEVTFYSVGDLVDRGPDSAGVIELCVQHNVQGISGNHELWLQTLFRERKFWPGALSQAMAGDWTLLSYGLTDHSPKEIFDQFFDLVPEAHQEFFKALPVWRKFTVGGETFRLIHGGMKTHDAKTFLPQAEKLSHQTGISVADCLCELVAKVQPDCLMWRGPSVRGNHPNLHKFSDGSTQIFGHIPIKKARVTKTWIGLDTGAGTCEPRMLTGIALPQRELIEIVAPTELVGDSSLDGIDL